MGSQTDIYKKLALIQHANEIYENKVRIDIMKFILNKKMND